MSTEADAVSETLASVASAGVQSASGDAGSVTKVALSELIAADKYLRSKDAASNAGRGLRFTKLTPPGAV